MKFLVDAQLPRRLCIWLVEAGHDAIHTLDLPAGNQTTDAELMALADSQDRVLVSKDDDFVQSYLVKRTPNRLLLISTGNIGNIELQGLLQKQLGAVVEALARYRFVELGRDALIIHE